jgi:predicted RNase H-like HicB family nuclease
MYLCFTKFLIKVKNKTFNIIVEQGIDGFLISSVVELPGCHTQAKSYNDLVERTKEAIELYLLENEHDAITQFVDVKQITV